MKLKEQLKNLTEDELIEAENKAYSKYLKATGTEDEGLAFAIWSVIDDEMFRRCNGDPFGQNKCL